MPFVPNRAERAMWPTRVALAVAVLALAGCGGGSSEAEPEGQFTGAPLEVQDPGAVHVHGLGYDEAADTLYVATHTGLFELGPGDAKPRRIGASRQDTMGFTLVEPKLFLGSGHPDARESLPPHLGLIRSTDRGRSWQPVSLLGEADFHVLRSQGRTVYGFDATGGRLLASTDGGETWAERAEPEPLVDLVLDPRDPEHVVASGSAVLYESKDGAASWRVVAGSRAGHLAWPSGARLYLLDASGTLIAAARPSGPWRRLSSLAAAPAALLAVDRQRLFAALHDGTIVQTNDGGATWNVRATP